MANLAIHWFRRDLRLHDNAALFEACAKYDCVVPIYIFDEKFFIDMQRNVASAGVLGEQVLRLQEALQKEDCNLRVFQGNPEEVLLQLAKDFDNVAVYFNKDYEPATHQRDMQIQKSLEKAGVEVRTFKDRVLFEESEILNGQKKPYSVFTAYKKAVLARIKEAPIKRFPSEKKLESLRASAHLKLKTSLENAKLDFAQVQLPPANLKPNHLSKYDSERDFPALMAGSNVGLYLNFGALSVREVFQRALESGSEAFASEILWRDFFIQILWHFPKSENASFRPEYDRIEWRKSKKDFQLWTQGQTGYPLVDAGMRELLATGQMHNRVRMVVASFLCKHLLIHWKQGERYFAEKLLDFELASNVGNWQWVAGSGCDAAPYFRIFNPQIQQKKFDPEYRYIKKWIPEWGTKSYPSVMIVHEEARGRCLQAYFKVLKK